MRQRMSRYAGTAVRIKSLLADERGMSNLLVTLMILPILLFLCFMIVPFFVYTMKLDHLNAIASHALKEAEAVGYMSPAIEAATSERLDRLGMGEIAVKGVSYPDYAGSTEDKVLRDSPDPTITVVIRYPAPPLARMLPAIGGSSSAGRTEGYFQVILYGRSEAYE